MKQRRCPRQNLALNATTGGNRGEPSNPVPRQEMSLQNKSDLPGIRYIDSQFLKLLLDDSRLGDEQILGM
jgi:hypothetical protein